MIIRSHFLLCLCVCLLEFNVTLTSEVISRRCLLAATQEYHASGTGHDTPPRHSTHGVERGTTSDAFLGGGK